MKSLFKTLACLLVLLSINAPATNAMSITKTATITSNTGNTAVFSFDQFDPALGTLNGVSFDLGVLAEVSITKTFAFGSSGCIPVDIDIQVCLPGNAVTADLTGPDANAVGFGSFGGQCLVTSSNPSCTLTSSDGIGMLVSKGSVADLSVFTGTGSVDFTASVGFQTLGPNDTATTQFILLSSGVNYLFTPAEVSTVPVPGGLPLLLGAIMGLWGMHRRKLW